MEPEYNAEEIETAAKKLKKLKAAGRNEVSAELIKYGCRKLYKQIASLLNVTSERGDHGPSCKIPKEGWTSKCETYHTPFSTTQNHHHNTDWSVLGADKNHIPLSQGAYQKGRSSTEQVFTIKILAEKAITSENYDIFLLFLDISKAFDTVDRSKLMEILKNILTPSELHMMTYL